MILKQMDVDILSKHTECMVRMISAWSLTLYIPHILIDPQFTAGPWPGRWHDPHDPCARMAWWFAEHLCFAVCLVILPPPPPNTHTLPWPSSLLIEYQILPSLIRDFCVCLSALPGSACQKGGSRCSHLCTHHDILLSGKWRARGGREAVWLKNGAR